MEQRPTDGRLPSYVLSNIERRLRQFRLSRQGLAEAMEMDGAQLSKVLTQKQMVRLDTLQRIGQALDMSLSEMFQESRQGPVSSPAELEEWLAQLPRQIMEQVEGILSNQRRKRRKED